MITRIKANRIQRTICRFILTVDEVVVGKVIGLARGSQCFFKKQNLEETGRA